jgi:hypothetical protein
MSQPLTTVDASALHLPNLQAFLVKHKLLAPNAPGISAKRFSLGALPASPPAAATGCQRH